MQHTDYRGRMKGAEVSGILAALEQRITVRSHHDRHDTRGTAGLDRLCEGLRGIDADVFGSTACRIPAR